MSGSQNKTQDKKHLIEALLFASPTGIMLSEISEKVKLPDKKCVNLLKELRKEREGKPIQIVFEGNRWKMIVRDDLTPSLHGMVALPPEIGKSIIKTLAVIAYKTPVKQSDIIYIRGNKAYDHIKRLEEEGFIKSKPQGRTKILKLSQRFYDYFHVTKGEEKYLFEQ